MDNEWIRQVRDFLVVGAFTLLLGWQEWHPTHEETCAIHLEKFSSRTTEE